MEYNYGKKSIWKWIILYVIIGAIAYGLIYYFFFYKNGNSYNNQTNYNVQNSNAETADWKTYRNDQYGFEIQYPQDWWMEEQINIITFQGHSSGPSQFALDISIESNPNKLSSKDFTLERLKEPEMGSGFNEFTPEEVQLFNNGKELELGGLTAFQLKEDNYEHIYLAKDYNIIKFYFPNTEKNITELEDPKVVNTVISTFKFTK